MKTKETSNPLGKTWDEIEQSRLTREQASKWFSNKSYLEQHKLSDKYFESRNPSLLTIEQVEEIWRKETGERGIIITNISKPNQKQFKQFDESLFKTYIDKFSDEDKRKALQILCTDLDMMLSR